MPEVASPLLTVKLTAPHPPRIAPRPALLEVLDTATTPLTLLSAPVAWGKTTTLAAWVGRCGHEAPVGWVTLDAGDDEPVRFWRYVLAAVRRALPDVGELAVNALSVEGADPLDAAVPALLNDLADSACRGLVVLDDYHAITDARIHEGVEYLLTYLPQTLRLVIAARQDPPLPLARLRARGQLTELRIADLRLDAGEAAAVLRDVLGREVGDDVVQELTARTGGWPGAVHLAGLAVRGEPDPAVALRDLPVDHHLLADLLASELLDALDPGVEDALVRISVLDRLTRPLCAAVLGQDSPALPDLDRSILPVEALDRRHEWYRLHPLLREALAARRHRRVDAEEVGELHRRAAIWLAAHDQEDAAIEHLLAGGHVDSAATLLIESIPSLQRRVGGATVTRLGDRFTLAHLRARPGLAAQLAWVNAQHGRHDRARSLLAVVDEAPEGDPPPQWASLRSCAAALRVAYTHVVDPDEMLRLARLATADEDDPRRRGHAVSRVALGLACIASGDHAGAVEAFQTALRGSATLEATTTLTTAGLLAGSFLALGEPEEAREVVDRWLPELAALEDEVGTACGSATLVLRQAAGQVARRRGDLDGAVAELEHAVEAGRAFNLAAPLCDALATLAELRVLQGRRGEARTLVGEAREIVRNEAVPPDVPERLDEVEAVVGRSAEQRARRAGALSEALTDRELSILRAMQADTSLRELAAGLYLSLNTVKGYARILYRKLGVRTRADAVARGRELGLI